MLMDLGRRLLLLDFWLSSLALGCEIDNTVEKGERRRAERREERGKDDDRNAKGNALYLERLPAYAMKDEDGDQEEE